MAMSGVTIVIVTYNSAGVIGSLLESLTPVQATTIVVDNGSQDETLEIVARYPGIKALRNRNCGYGRAANLGFAQTNTPYVMLVNPDVVLTGHTVETLVATLARFPDIGAAGPRMFHREAGGRRIYAPYPAFDADGLHYTDWILGALMMIRREALQKVGMFDENIFLYFEEKDLSRRLLAGGYRLAVVRDAEAEHAGGKSSSASPRVLAIKAWHAGWSKAYYHRKHLSRLSCARKTSSQVLQLVARTLRSLATGKTGAARQSGYELCGVLAACFGMKAFSDGVGRLT